MKKLLSVLFCTLLLGSTLGGCANVPSKATMQLMPYALNQEATDLLALANINLQQTTVVPFAYEAGENLHSISISRYILNDALEWERDADYNACVFDEEPLAEAGRFALTAEANEPFTLNIRADGIGYTYCSPALPDDLPENATCGVGTVPDSLDIVYGEELPILVRTFRAKDEAFSYSTKDYDDPARFADDLFTEAFTVTFSDTSPA